jgi:carbamoyl-phosphate synthase small subunit
MPLSDVCRLVLEDGAVFEGVSFGHREPVAGEVVFNTGMTGYPETLTDPSYRGQILVLTYPLMGNYGVPGVREDEHGLPVGFESSRVHVSGLVVSEHSERYSHHLAARSLGAWMRESEVPAICGVDTRALTKRLRQKGTMLGRVEFGAEKIEFADPNATHLVQTVSAAEDRSYDGSAGAGSRPATVVVVDCGCKTSILRSLLDRGLSVVRVPHDHYFLNLDFDGLLISNGPGDPQMCKATVKNVERALAVGKPILGICLGHQILGLAVGGETYKLKFGHRSQNQPCVELAEPGAESAIDRRSCYVTAQNHGYALRGEGLPEDWRVWFENANDGTVEGIRHASKPFFGVQFHPEARPGPVDTAWIFDEFADVVQRGVR